MAVLLLASDPDWIQYLVVPRGELEHPWLVQASLYTVSLAYFGIVVVLGQIFAYKRDLPFRIVVMVLGLLFLWRALTQLLSVWILHHPLYRTSLLVQAVSAVLSTLAVLALLWALPMLHRLPTPAEMEAEVTERRRVEEASREKDERYRSFVESTQDYAMYMLDLDGRVLSWNVGAERIKGYRAEEVIGKSFTCFYTEEDRAAGVPEASLNAAAAGGYEAEGWRVRKNGSRFRANITMRPLYAVGGELRGYSKITRDLSKTREMEHRFEMVFQYAPDAMLIADRSGRIRMANRRAEKLYQYCREELLTASVEELVPLRLREESRRSRLGYFTATTERFEEKTLELEVGMNRWGLRKDGTEFLLEMRASPIELDGEPTVLMLHRDITDRYKADQRFRALLETAPDAMLIVDGQGRIDLANLQAEQLFGYTRAELLGQPVEMLIPAGKRGGHEEQRLSYAAEPRYRQMGVGMELEAVRKDGSLCPVEISLSPLEDPEGLSVTAAIRDVSERRRAEARFRGLLESAPDAMVISGSDGRIELVNLEAERFFGYARAELLGQPVEMLIPPDLREGYRRDQALFAKGEGLKMLEAGPELRALRKDGTEVPVEINFSPLEGPSGISMTAAIRDVTERKRAAELLAEKVRELRSSNEELEQFAYIASHDLQEPLRMVASYTQLLARRYKGKLDGDADEFIHYAVDGTQRMKRLIEDLLVYSRAGKGAPPVDHIPAGRVMEEALQNLEARIAETGAKVMVEPLPTVIASEVVLAQIFQNLVGNAIKYCKDRTPEVRVSARNRDEEWVFSVADNGIGIDPQYFDRIFLIFQRLHGRHDYEGTGIGLAICKRMLHRMGGRIWVESMPGQGSTFFFSLPKG